MTTTIALAGKGGVPASDADAEQALNNMVGAIQNGMISGFMAFDTDGHPIEFH